ncbi:MAG: N-acetylmuramoyl-L-alanine amidase [Oscillochloris sp.]|nr:N-acetylmuramoyl-L-alanine amidase [Oscillochloris sp.]
MIDESLMVEQIGTPDKAGDTREGQKIELIVIADTEAAGFSVAARIAEGHDLDDTVPNYWIDSDGSTRQFVADDRAGNGLEIAIYQKRRRNIDRIAISVLLERREGFDYSDAQIRALHGLLDQVMNRHGLADSALATVMPDDEDRKRVYPYLPPPPPLPEDMTGDLLGAGVSPEQELWAGLWSETYLPRTGAGANLGQAFPRYSAKLKLGAPIGPNDKTTTVVFENGTYSVQPFATDLIFYQGTDYSGVRSLNDLYDDDAAEIPATGLARALLEKSYAVAIAKSEQILGAPFKTNKTLQAGWRFHLVAKNGRLGPAISANYIFKASQDYAFQVFGADTLYTPMSDQAGVQYLNRTEPSHPDFNALWAETYKYAKAPFDPNSDFHKKAVELRIGIPLSAVYSKALGGSNYQIQVWSLDTLYKGPDGQIKRMTDLPQTTEVATWSPTAPKPVPTHETSEMGF